VQELNRFRKEMMAGQAAAGAQASGAAV